MSERTANLHFRLIKRVLKAIGKNPDHVTREDLRRYLMKVQENMASSTYKNFLASMKRYFRDFLGMENVVRSFRFPQLPVRPITIPSKDDLKKFYQTLTRSRDKALFMILATSGLRHSELLSLDRYEDVDFSRRMLIPKKAGNQSKHVWISFYNEESEKALNYYLSQIQDDKPRLFPITKRHVLRIFKRASEATGVKVTPQILRDWFCSEMGEIGVPDRYVDAFCGRVPKSVLARHYTDYSPEKLKRIYDKANLKVLN